VRSAEQKRAYQRDWHNTAYSKNPEKYRDRTRAHRESHGEAVNAQRRQRSSQKRAEELQLSAEASRAKLGREPQTLNEWFPTQARFSEWAQLAREIGVSPRTVLDWRTGKHPAVRAHRRKLYEITGLSCFADAANWKAHEKPARKIGEKASVPVLAELVVRCGLATRELQQIRTSQIQAEGIQLASGRLILFGDRWEEVSRSALDAWLASARPTNFLFFLRKPVDRDRPVSAVWISRVLHASGISAQERRSARLRHFAGDFSRLGSGQRFLNHLRNAHGLSRSGSREALEALRKRKALVSVGGGTLNGGEPEKAFDVLYRPKNEGGRPAVKRKMFLAARHLRNDERLAWPEIARRLDPDGYKDDPRKAGERMRLGVTYLNQAKG
jgi:hypothetical protein